MVTKKTPPNIIWICKDCWKRRRGDAQSPVPFVIDTCTDCGAEEVLLVYLKVDSMLRR